jgi:hypothetical protein
MYMIKKRQLNGVKHQAASPADQLYPWRFEPRPPPVSLGQLALSQQSLCGLLPSGWARALSPTPQPIDQLSGRKCSREKKTLEAHRTGQIGGRKP